MTTLAPEDLSRSRGRPREFDMDAALDKALLVFSERGYHATSISELTEAMGLTSGSVYKAFKDKRGVFLAAFDRYRAIRRGKISESMVGAETGRDKLRALLGLYAVSSHGESGRRGCLVVGSANEISTFDPEAATPEHPELRQAPGREQVVLRPRLGLEPEDVRSRHAAERGRLAATPNDCVPLTLSEGAALLRQPASELTAVHAPSTI